jgi:hypothetical protein
LTSEEREERLAKNEAVFRTVNESIGEQASRFGGLDQYEFICECATAGCFERVALTRAEYESVRQDGKRFFVVPGHQDIQVEFVVETHPTFLVVEKDGPAGEVAEATDPRAGED